MSGKPGRSGRKPAPKNLIDRMLARSEPSLPDIWQGLVDLAMGVRIGKLNENGEMVNVYGKPPDKEAIAEIMNRHFGRPKIEIDQRTKHEVELDPSRLLAAVREAEARGAAFLSMPEHQLATVDEPSVKTTGLVTFPTEGQVIDADYSVVQEQPSRDELEVGCRTGDLGL